MERITVNDKLAIAIFLLSALFPADRFYTYPGITGGKPRSYHDKDLDVRDHRKYTASRYVGSQINATYFVYNKGSHPAQVVLEMSPDGSVWVDTEPVIVNPKHSQVLVLPYYLHYSRVAYKTVDKSKFTDLSVWLQTKA